MLKGRDITFLDNKHVFRSKKLTFYAEGNIVDRMKQTFSNRYFDWTLMGVSLFFLVTGMINLADGFQYFTVFLFKITLFLASALALYSLVSRKSNGEQFARIFVIVALIIPGILLLNQILTDFIFYGINHLSLLQDPLYYLKLIAGIVLLYYSIKFSNQKKSDRIVDYGILVIGIGVFVICYTLIQAIEPIFVSEQTSYPVWKTAAKSILGILTLMTGGRIRDQKLKLSKNVI